MSIILPHLPSNERRSEKTMDLASIMPMKGLPKEQQSEIVLKEILMRNFIQGLSRNQK